MLEVNMPEDPPVHDGSYLVMIIPVQCLLLCSCDQCFAFPFPAITILFQISVSPTICLWYMSNRGLSFHCVHSSFSFLSSSSSGRERVTYSLSKASPQRLFPPLHPGQQPSGVLDRRWTPACITGSFAVCSIVLWSFGPFKLDHRTALRDHLPAFFHLEWHSDMSCWWISGSVSRITLYVGIQRDVIRGGGRWLLHFRYLRYLLVVMSWLRASRPVEQQRLQGTPHLMLTLGTGSECCIH